MATTRPPTLNTSRTAQTVPDDRADRPWDRAGVIRAVRRRLDLSQRELAALIKVGVATVARAESPTGSVSLQVVEAIMQLAELQWQVVDKDGREVAPEPMDVARDHGGRRFPSHLDAEVAPSLDLPPAPGRRRRRVTYRHRRNRDMRREQQGFIAARHPVRDEVRWLSAPPSVRRSHLEGALAGRRDCYVPYTFVTAINAATIAGEPLPHWVGQLCSPRRPIPYWTGPLVYRPLGFQTQAQAA